MLSTQLTEQVSNNTAVAQTDAVIIVLSFYMHQKYFKTTENYLTGRRNSSVSRHDLQMNLFSNIFLWALILNISSITHTRAHAHTHIQNDN